MPRGHFRHKRAELLRLLVLRYVQVHPGCTSRQVWNVFDDGRGLSRDHARVVLGKLEDLRLVERTRGREYVTPDTWRACG